MNLIVLSVQFSDWPLNVGIVDAELSGMALKVKRCVTAVRTVPVQREYSMPVTGPT